MSGGDWMVGGRFLAHFIPVPIAILAVALSRLPRGRLPLVLAGALLGGLGAVQLFVFATGPSTGCPIWSRIHCQVGSDTTRFTWFEQHNLINRRDMPVVQVLDRMVDRLVRLRPGPVVIMSGQMGFIPYHLAARHPGRIRFIDRWGLVERTLTDCPSARRIPRSPKGLEMDYAQYFKLERARHPRCPLPLPDIIYDLRAENARQVAGQGYGLVYLQRAKVICGDSRHQLAASVFVALRRDLLADEDRQDLLPPQ